MTGELGAIILMYLRRINVCMQAWSSDNTTVSRYKGSQMRKQIVNFVQNQHAHSRLSQEEIKTKSFSLLHQFSEFYYADFLVQQDIERCEVLLLQDRHGDLAAVALECVLDGLCQLPVRVDNVQVARLVLLDQTFKLGLDFDFSLSQLVLYRLSCKGQIFIINYFDFSLWNSRRKKRIKK